MIQDDLDAKVEIYTKKLEDTMAAAKVHFECVSKYLAESTGIAGFKQLLDEHTCGPPLGGRIIMDTLSWTCYYGSLWK